MKFKLESIIEWIVLLISLMLSGAIFKILGYMDFSWEHLFVIPIVFTISTAMSCCAILVLMGVIYVCAILIISLKRKVGAKREDKIKSKSRGC